MKCNRCNLISCYIFPRRCIRIVSVILYLLMISSGQMQDIDPYRCWQHIGLMSSKRTQRCPVSWSMLVFAGMNITLLCENMLFFGCLVQHIHRITSILSNYYFGVTYKPGWAGYDLVVIFMPLFWLIFTCPYNKNIQYNTVQLHVYSLIFGNQANFSFVLLFHDK